MPLVLSIPRFLCFAGTDAWNIHQGELSGSSGFVSSAAAAAAGFCNGVLSKMFVYPAAVAGIFVAIATQAQQITVLCSVVKHR